VNEAMPAKQLEQLRISVNRGRPWGGPEWVRRMADRLGPAFTIRNPGRPRKKGKTKGNQ